jgi:hypothetical protein
METFNLFSFLFVLALMFLGAVAHWLHKKLRREVQGSIVDYFVADYPGRSASVIVVFIGSAAGVGFTDIAHIIEPSMLWEQLRTTHTIPSICAAAIGGALTWGWSFDSGINKGASDGLNK